MERAKGAGVSVIVAVGENISDAKRNIALALKYPILKPAAGLYPTHLDFSEAEEMIFFIRRMKDKLISIGEVGLDFWAVKDEKERAIQKEIFGRFIDLAIELDLPLNVHSRSAGRHAIRMLTEGGANRAQLHAFDGKASSALPALEAGYFFSIPPSIVRSQQKQKLVKKLPLSCLLIETDSPVLGPLPNERNEPVNAAIAVNAIAEIKGVKKEEVMETALNNTLRVYGDKLIGGV